VPDSSASPKPFERLPWPVRTARLLIRPIEVRDLTSIHAIRSDHEVSLWLSGRAPSYDVFVDEWTSSDRFDTTLVLEREERVVGDVFLRVTDAWSQRETREQARGTQGDIGWLIDPAYAGHGLATEAAREVLRICFDGLGLRRVSAAAFADNVASVRVMEKIGMRIEGHGVREALHRDRGWVDGVNAALLANEWRAKRR
jgi:RimJ/RimL family protein N-acetyltransferase